MVLYNPRLGAAKQKIDKNRLGWMRFTSLKTERILLRLADRRVITKPSAKVVLRRATDFPPAFQC
jgi:hypothetical protein